MDISATKFYQEVTGSKTGNATVTLPAFKRWGIPDEAILRKGSRLSIHNALKYLDMAKATYAVEVAEKAARKVEATAHVRRPKNGPASTDAEVLARLAAVEDLLQALGVTIERINERTYRWEKDAARKAGK